MPLWIHLHHFSRTSAISKTNFKKENELSLMINTDFKENILSKQFCFMTVILKSFSVL